MNVYPLTNKVGDINEALTTYERGIHFRESLWPVWYYTGGKQTQVGAESVTQ